MADPADLLILNAVSFEISLRRTLQWYSLNTVLSVDFFGDWATPRQRSIGLFRLRAALAIAFSAIFLSKLEHLNVKRGLARVEAEATNIIEQFVDRGHERFAVDPSPIVSVPRQDRPDRNRQTPGPGP